jgi:hypothetical protein
MGPKGSDGANGYQMHIGYWKNISVRAKVSQVSELAHGPLVYLLFVFVVQVLATDHSEAGL